jgi:hypothetical protein
VKRLILIIVFMLCALGAGWAQSCTPSALATCTPNLDLWLPSANYPNWNVPLNANFSLIDQAFGASHNGFPIILGSTSIAGGSTNYNQFDGHDAQHHRRNKHSIGFND